MYKVYGKSRTRSTRALWALEEVGADYEFIKVDLMAGAHRRSPFRDLNPASKVPTLVDGDLVISESAAICTYLGEKLPESGLVPSDPAQRAHYHQWCFYVMSELEQPLWTLAKHNFVLPEQWRMPAINDCARWEFKQAVKPVAMALGDNEFIAGDHFTGADLLIAHTLSWANNAEVPIEHENLIAYAKRILARPALARTREREQQT